MMWNEHKSKYEQPEMNECNKILLNQFTNIIKEYLKTHTIEELCKLIFKCIPRSMVSRIMGKILRIK